MTVLTLAEWKASIRSILAQFQAMDPDQPPDDIPADEWASLLRGFASGCEWLLDAKLDCAPSEEARRAAKAEMDRILRELDRELSVDGALTGHA